MKEFTASRGPFRDWGGDPDRRADFLLRLIAITKRRVNKAFVCVVDLAGFDRANEEYCVKESFGGAYGLACVTCLKQVEIFLVKHHRHDRIVHVPEKGDAGQGAVLALLADEPMLGPVAPGEKVDPVTKRWSTPFQPSDFIA